MKTKSENPIKKYSTDLGIPSIMSLSLIIDTSCDILYHVAKGRRLPTPEVAEKLSRVFGISYDQMLLEFEEYRNELREDALNQMNKIQKR